MTVAEPSSTGPISLAGDKVMSRNGTEKSLVICVPLGTTPLSSRLSDGDSEPVCLTKRCIS